MKVLHTKAFNKDLVKLRDKKAAEDIEDAIRNIKDASDKRSIANLKSITGYKHYYRIKLNEYRLGIKINDKDNTVELIRFAHRKDIYKYFPPK